MAQVEQMHLIQCQQEVNCQLVASRRRRGEDSGAKKVTNCHACPIGIEINRTHSELILAGYNLERTGCAAVPRS